MHKRVLVLGATGMLARPVVRTLAADGFVVRAASRSPARARRVLPMVSESVAVDVQDEASVKRAMEGCDAVYLNLAPSNSQRAFDPDLAGAKLVAKLAPKCGIARLMRISTMGIPQGASDWWVAQRKEEADDALMRCGVPCTIFRPTWFMESLPLFLLGKRIMLPAAPDEPLYWLAGEDYAAQVSAALRNDAAANKTYIVQGRYPASFKHAVIRFAAAFDPTLSLLRMPQPLLELASLASAKVRYLRDLLAYTFKHATGFHAQEAFDELGEPSMSIEDYARQIRATGDVPRK